MSHEPSPEAKAWQWALLVIVILLGVGALAVGVYLANRLRLDFGPVEGSTVQTWSNVTSP